MTDYKATDSPDALALATSSNGSLVGYRYSAGRVDHTVISDSSEIEGCVTVRNAGGQCFPVQADLIRDFAQPPQR